jgi:hypothetical protein
MEGRIYRQLNCYKILYNMLFHQKEKSLCGRIGDKFLKTEELKVSDLMLTFGWGSPIGIGIFLVCLAGMIYLLSKASKKKE